MINYQARICPKCNDDHPQHVACTVWPCTGCRHDIPTGPLCNHPDVWKPGFFSSPQKDCYVKGAR